MNTKYNGVLKVQFNDGSIEHILTKDMSDSGEALKDAKLFNINISRDMYFNNRDSSEVREFIRFTPIKNLNDLVEYCDNNGIIIAEDRFLGYGMLIETGKLFIDDMLNLMFTE